MSLLEKSQRHAYSLCSMYTSVFFYGLNNLPL